MKIIKNEKLHRKLVGFVVGKEKELIDFNHKKGEIMVKISVYKRYHFLYVEINNFFAHILFSEGLDPRTNPVFEIAYGNAEWRVIGKMARCN